MIAISQAGTTVIVAILGFLGIVGAAFITAYLAKRMSRPEQAHLYVETAELLVGMSEKQVQRIDRERAESEKRMDEERKALEERFEVRIAEVEHELKKQIAELQMENEKLREELVRERDAKAMIAEQNEELKGRVQHLEDELQRLHRGGPSPG